MPPYLATREELPPLGALCLDYTDDIHRPPGDPLNELSFPFPLVHEKVTNASLWKVVDSQPYSDEFLLCFVSACERLAEKGAIGVITSCGFLAQVQKRLSAMISIPIATSSLLQVPLLMASRPESHHVGVITFDEAVLGKVHLEGVGITYEMQKRLTVVGTPENGSLRGMIRDGKPYIHDELSQELVQCAKDLLARDNQVKAIVLECTQMPPFAKAIQKAISLPVYDVITLIDWFYSGLHCADLPKDEFKEDGYRQRKRGPKEMK